MLIVIRGSSYRKFIWYINTNFRDVLYTLHFELLRICGKYIFINVYKVRIQHNN